MQINEQQVIGELVAQDYRTAAVFHQHGIDFCCKGNRSIGDACRDKRVDTASLLNALQHAVSDPGKNAEADYASWPLDQLADHIEKKHHRYVETRIQDIKPFLHKVAKVHGDRHPELITVEQLFSATAGELTAHMKKEELILFPFIRKLARAKSTNEPVSAPPFGTIRNPIEMMHQEHDTEGDRFHQIAELTSGYTPPADACNTYRVTFELLREFEADLHLHIHLENNILFPKAVELESSLLCPA